MLIPSFPSTTRFGERGRGRGRGGGGGIVGDGGVCAGDGGDFGGVDDGCCSAGVRDGVFFFVAIFVLVLMFLPLPID